MTSLPSAGNITLKRIYAAPAADEGMRILVECDALLGRRTAA